MTSSRSKMLLGQPMFKLLQKIGDREVIHMEIGDPDFDTPNNIVRAATKALAEGQTHYTSSWGLPVFVESIRQATLRSRGFLPDANQVLVTQGANVGIYYAIYCTCDVGDTVLIPDPGFPTYESAVIAAGCFPVRYNLGNDFKIDKYKLQAALMCAHPKLVILNSPSNPTGAVTDGNTLDAVYQLLKEHDAYGFSDEIYARMTYENFYSISAYDGCRHRIILSNGFSKAFAMTGWRLGSLIAPPDIAEKMMLLLQTTQSCVQPFIQMAGVEAIEGNQTQVNMMMDTYRHRRDYIVERLNAMGLKCHTPGGAFYVFPDIRAYFKTSEEAADKLLEAGVAVLPGTDFGPAGEGYIRLTYATSMENIEAAMNKMEGALCE